MRVFPACFWPFLIYGTMILLPKEGAGSVAENKITLLGHFKMGLYKFSCFYSHMFWNVHYVLLGTERRNCFTPGCVIQTGKFCKRLIIQPVNNLIQPARFSILKLNCKFLIFSFFCINQFLKIFRIWYVQLFNQNKI